jgi:glycerol kinase
MEKYILTLDQGTTNTRAIIFDREGNIISTAQRELRQIYPKPGEVEHDPHEIWGTQLEMAKEALHKAGLTASKIASIGVSNQRETTLLWDKKSGDALYNAIVWQCRRTNDLCQKIKETEWESEVKKKTGLIVDPYFSGTKVKWILDNVHKAREKAAKGEALFGTVDTWLIWNLTGGKVHVTDYTNASRTMLFNIGKLSWDEDILELLDIPQYILPEARSSSEVYGYTLPEYFGREIPIAGDAGDQQAALFGQKCFTPGTVKNTYGTGSFMLMNTGEKIIPSKSGLLTTIAIGIDGKVEYALEGSVFTTGAAVQWLRDEMNLIDHSAESEFYAKQVENSGGVYVVPAFSGLGAPYWDPNARGLIIGITRGTNKNHVIRATLESIAYQVKDVLKCMEDDSGMKLKDVRVDGGGSSNDFLMQFQADILGIPILRPLVTETTALGAAYLAGLAVKYWKNREELMGNWKIERFFKPRMTEEERDELLGGWRKAVARSRGWAS